MGKLYIVATPIGNLEDITLRAIRILKEVDLILCENVSESHRLLKHYEITTKTTNYYSNSRLDKIDKIIKMLEDGKDLALISDAGTPCVSDPGALLIERIHRYNSTPSVLSDTFPKGRIETQMLPTGLNTVCDTVSEISRAEGVNCIEIITIPGPSAVTALYSVSGTLGNAFSFYGFVPQKKGRQTFIKNILIKTKEGDIPIIFYESVHRFEKLIEQLSEHILNLQSENAEEQGEYVFTIGRELTKMHEQIIKGNILEIKSYFENNQDKIRGEFVIMIEYKDYKIIS